MAFIKLSILSLYGNIFSSKRFHYALWIVATVVSTWALSIATVGIFQCWPIAYGWGGIPDGYCFNYGLVVLVAGVVNIITDFTILGMPIPFIWKLHTTRQKKWELTFTFALGGSACVVSIIRLAFALRVGTTSDGSCTFHVDHIDLFPSQNHLIFSLPVILMALLTNGFGNRGQHTSRPLVRRRTDDGDTSRLNPDIQTHLPANILRLGSYWLSADIQRRLRQQGNRSVTDQIEMVVHTSRGGNWVRVPDRE
ncbi:hypothetical protein F4859DRAFT_157058 [Xylaria cf. heliscus]|nr:hypothetical protein F4859DRAFT_157058 [Xylaria cf. heliscus]